MPKYKIGELALDTDGTYWIQCYQDIAEQGGCRFGWGSMGLSSLADALEMLSCLAKRHEDKIKEKVDEKQSNS
jgi:hypothetical protein